MRSIVVLWLLIGAMLSGPVVAVCDAAERTSTKVTKKQRRQERKERKRQEQLRDDLGVTFRNCRRVAKQLDEAGLFDKDDRKLTAKRIMAVLVDEAEPRLVATAEGDKLLTVWEEKKVRLDSPDWEAIMVWLEEFLIPFILMLMEIFGGMSDATLTPALEVATAPQVDAALILAA